MKQRLFLGITLAWLATANAAFAPQPGKEPQEMPVVCEQDRYYATPITASGEKLRFLTDSGGGLYINEKAVRRLNLIVTNALIDGQTNLLARLPAWASNGWIPPVRFMDGLLPVANPNLQVSATLFKDIDGVLGTSWFCERIWTFDYLHGRLLLHEPGDVPPHDPSGQVTLGFQIDPATKQRTSNFPRITVRVDDEPIDLLLDTGATTELTEAALAKLHDGRPAMRATCFITASIFSRWRAKHPDWRVMEEAEVKTGAAMIEAPQVLIAGCQVGPVWFTQRGDENFTKWMSQWMDKTVVGALGGNALRYFVVTLDYPNALAVFERNVH